MLKALLIVAALLFFSFEGRDIFMTPADKQQTSDGSQNLNTKVNKSHTK